MSRLYNTFKNLFKGSAQKLLAQKLYHPLTLQKI